MSVFLRSGERVALAVESEVSRAANWHGGAGNLAQVRAYYDSTWLDYRMLWLNACDRALHFGYWDGRTHSHAASLIRMNEVLAERVGRSRVELK